MSKICNCSPNPSKETCDCCTGTTTSGLSLAGLFTSGATSKASIDSAGYGTRAFDKTIGSTTSSSNQNDSSSFVRITGIRLWMGRRSSLGSVVMMVQDLTISPPRSRYESHRPAKAKGSPEVITIRMGLLALPTRCHS